MERVRRSTLEQQAFEILRRQILDGTLPGGAPLVQGEVALRLGASRMPVRDALRRLAAEGLVEPDDRGTYTVRSFNEDDLREIYATRRLVEAMAAVQAVPRLTDDDLVELGDLLDAMAEAAAGERVDDYVALNQDFHMLIYEACGLRRLARFIASLWSGIAPLTPLTVKGQLDSSLAEHREIHRHLVQRDSARVHEAIERHIANAEARLFDEQDADHARAGGRIGAGR